MTNLNLDEFAKVCLINRTENATEINKLIDNLENSLPTEDFVQVINYFFEISNNYNVILHLLKIMNKYKSKLFVSTLVDALILKENYRIKIQEPEIQTQIRVQVAKVLANIKDNSAVNPILYCLNNKDENYKLRLSCAEALGKIGDNYAIKPLSEILRDDNERSVYLKESAAFALGMIGDTNAVEPLVNILESKKSIMDKFSYLKERVIEALSKLDVKSERVFKALKNSLNDSSLQVRINAIEALSNLDDERVTETLYSCLTDSSSVIVRNAIIALFNVNGEEILYKILNDYSLPEQTIKLVREVVKEVECIDDEEEHKEEN
ncbi:MAG: HEAT repeat domain-containing protein [Candidatus Gastranaerophilaceae bacterium]